MSVFKNIWFGCCCFVTLLTAGCTHFDEHETGGNGAPDGHFIFAPRFKSEAAMSIVSRALDNPDLIDDVYMFIFSDTNLSGDIDDGDKLEFREYYEYGKTQDIYLVAGQTYFVYAVANLDNSNIPDPDGTGDVTVGHYFDDVETYGALMKKYVQFNVRTPDDIGKMIMTTDNPDYDPANPKTGEIGGGVIKVEYNSASETFEPDIPLYKVQAKFIVKIYNKVSPTPSGVTPMSLTTSSFPRYSYLVQRAADYADRNGDGVIVDAGDDHYSSAQTMLPTATGPEPYNYSSNPDGGTALYTVQTMTFYCFENRRGTVDLDDPKDSNGDPITHYNDGTPIGTDIPAVYHRYGLAPSFSSYLMLLSLTDTDVLRTYIHAGKGRLDPDPAKDNDNIHDYNVERNCVYTFNVIINSTDNVLVDTRREFLAQSVLFDYPIDMRVDAHYVDIPSYISGTKAGIAKLQAGTVPLSNVGLDSDGQLTILNYDQTTNEPVGWEPMTDEDTDDNWLRLSWIDPYKPTRQSMATRGGLPDEPTTPTLYVEIAEPQVDGYSGATPILHFNEYVDPTAVTAYPPATTNPSNPPRRAAAIRVGFYEGATTIAEYEQMKTDDPDSELPFFRPIYQYGLKTIGQVGSWDPIKGAYATMLGVESIEETSAVYYRRPKKSDTDVALHDYNASNGPYWTYGGAYSPDLNHAYDGKSATTNRYMAYARLNGYNQSAGRWDNAPVRWYGSAAGETYSNPPGVAPLSPAYVNSIYNPFFNTNAVDYCMRKNRDMNGDGIITGEEIKWYLPSPTQMMQMYAWRGAFKGGTYSLNTDMGPSGSPLYPGTGGSAYVPFNTYYWTAFETGEGYARAVDFSGDYGVFASRAITERGAVRCVRDMPGSMQNDMFYTSDDYLVVDLTDYFPEGSLDDDKNNWNSDELHDPANNNSIAAAFIVSRWYVTTGTVTGNTHTGNATKQVADGNANGSGNALCGGYAEGAGPAGTSFDDPNRWFRPSVAELSYIYNYTGLIEAKFKANYPGGPDPYTGNPTLKNYHNFITGTESWHWAQADITSGNDRWRVNFENGLSGHAQKNNNSSYRRCIYYLSDAELKIMKAKAKP